MALVTRLSSAQVSVAAALPVYRMPQRSKSPATDRLVAGLSLDGLAEVEYNDLVPPPGKDRRGYRNRSGRPTPVVSVEYPSFKRADRMSSASRSTPASEARAGRVL